MYTAFWYMPQGILAGHADGWRMHWRDGYATLVPDRDAIAWIEQHPRRS